MNKLYVYAVLLCFLSSYQLFAQTGIGTREPHSSAILHLNSTNKGLLISKVSLASATDASTIASPAVGLLVWNTGTGGLTPEGIYYWHQSKWNMLSTGSSSDTPSSPSTGWNTSGTNAGNYSGANTSIALGTNTYDDLIFKVNSTTSGRIGVNGSVSLGQGSTATAQNGVAIGNNTQSTANQSTAIGANTVAAGQQSVAAGYNARTNSNNETAIGYNTVTSGQNTTAVGAGASASGQFATAIGYNASTAQQNAVVIGNATDANVGIGTSTPNTTVKLDVHGQYKFGSRGTVQKNKISFEVWPGVSINNLQPGGSRTLSFAIPSGATPSSTRATIVVTPASDFEGNSTFSISNPRMTSTSSITINLTNISGSATSLNSAHFYVTIDEF
ncbi:MAG: hypothetical protein ACO1N4_07305 [Pedobacter sp.]